MLSLKIKVKEISDPDWNYYHFHYNCLHFSSKEMEIEIYCGQSPVRSISPKVKVCSILVIGEDINIYTHSNSSFNRIEIYEVIKDNLDKFLKRDGFWSF